MEYQIYLLRDPLTGDVRYVGSTKRPLRERLATHISSTEGSTAKLEWISGLRAAGKRPSIELIETVSRNYGKREEFWINHYHSISPLFNSQFRVTTRGIKKMEKQIRFERGMRVGMFPEIIRAIRAFPKQGLSPATYVTGFCERQLLGLLNGEFEVPEPQIKASLERAEKLTAEWIQYHNGK